MSHIIGKILNQYNFTIKKYEKKIKQYDIKINERKKEINSYEKAYELIKEMPDAAKTITDNIKIKEQQLLYFIKYKNEYIEKKNKLEAAFNEFNRILKECCEHILIEDGYDYHKGIQDYICTICGTRR